MWGKENEGGLTLKEGKNMTDRSGRIRGTLDGIHIRRQFDGLLGMVEGISPEKFLIKENTPPPEVFPQKSQKPSFEDDVGQSTDIVFFNCDHEMPHHRAGDLTFDLQAPILDFNVVMSEIHIQDHGAQAF
jgi:hypothetical protein